MTSKDNQDGQIDDALVLRHIIRPGPLEESILPSGRPGDFRRNRQDALKVNTGTHPNQNAFFLTRDALFAGAGDEFDDLPGDDLERAYRLTMRACASCESSLEESAAAFVEKCQCDIFSGDLRDAAEEAPFISIHVPAPALFEPTIKHPVWKRFFAKKNVPAKKKRLTGLGFATGKPGLAKKEKLSLPKGRGVLLMFVIAGVAFYVLNGGKSCQGFRPSQTTPQAGPVYLNDLRYAPDNIANTCRGRTNGGESSSEDNGVPAKLEEN